MVLKCDIDKAYKRPFPDRMGSRAAIPDRTAKPLSCPPPYADTGGFRFMMKFTRKQAFAVALSALFSLAVFFRSAHLCHRDAPCFRARGINGAYLSFRTAPGCFGNACSLHPGSFRSHGRRLCSPCGLRRTGRNRIGRHRASAGRLLCSFLRNGGPGLRAGIL